MSLDEKPLLQGSGLCPKEELRNNTTPGIGKCNKPVGTSLTRLPYNYVFNPRMYEMS